MNSHSTSLLLVLPLVTVITAFSSSSTRAEANLQITEIWPGGLPGAEATSDWFEITNFGDLPATGLDGNLYFDDSSGNPTLSDPMTRIATIDPDESVIYLTTWEDDANGDAAVAIASFVAMWGPVPDLQIGTVLLGSGFGAQGDAAHIFDGNTAEANTIDHEEYVGSPTVTSYVANADGTWTARLAQVGVLGAYEGNLPADDLSPDPAIGSPGRIVPEPTSLALSLVGMLTWLGLAPGRRALVDRHDPI